MHHGTVPHVSIMAYLAEKVAGEQHPRNGENIFRIQLARSSILDLGALPESSLEPMPSFQPIIVMHSSFAIGPLPPCIPFISNPMAPHILAKKENFSPIPTDPLLSLMSILDRTAICIFALGVAEDSPISIASHTKVQNPLSCRSWIQPANMPKQEPLGVCSRISMVHLTPKQ